MNCKSIDRYFQAKLSEAEFNEHLKSCKTCSEVVRRIDESMAVLDEKVEVPSDLVEKLMLRVRLDTLSEAKPQRSVDLSKYLQLAAVITVGIFLGFLLGSRANPIIFLSKKEKKEKALIEYRESHHLSDQSSIYSF